MVYGVVKRVLVGRPMQSERLGHTLLPKRIALPVFASDALSSVAYATEEILIVLSVGGIAFFSYTPWIALTVGVSVSAGIANLASAFPALNARVTIIAVLVVATIALLNLRGVRESGTVFAIPTYCFIGAVALMIIWGVIRLGLGHQLTAESAGYHIPATRSYTGLLLVFLLLRAFSAGCTALTGVEAISNGVPAFRKPKSKNAATTLAMLGAIAVSMFFGVTALALVSHVHICPSAADCVPHVTDQRPVIAQVGRAVFGDTSPLFYLLQLVTALILVLAANTAFNGFPVLASILS